MAKAKKKKKTDRVWTPTPLPDDEPLFSDPLEGKIEAERERLARADSLLICLIAAINERQEGGGDDATDGYADFENVARMACELVRTTHRNLDSVNMHYDRTPKTPEERHIARTVEAAQHSFPEAERISRANRRRWARPRTRS